MEEVCMYSIFIKNGLIVDGTGAAAYPANLGISGDKITYIGNEVFEAEQTIDAAGKMVTPGFIDVHSHGDLTMGEEFTGLAKLSQGITTEIVGQCGLSAIPVSGARKNVVIEYFKGSRPAYAREHLDEFATLESFAKYSENRGLYANTAMFIGHCTVRMSVMGMDNRPATEEELEAMRVQVRLAMEQGAVGLSSGLVYAPGPFAPKEELIELCKVVKEYNGFYVTHMRNESDTVEAALQEALDVADATGVKLWISHHKAQGVKNFGKIKKTVAMIEEYRAKGLEIYYDIYPYVASSTQCSAMISPRFQTEGRAGLVEKLKDPAFRAEVKQDMISPKVPYDNFYLNCGSFENVTLAACLNTPEADGMTIAEYARKTQTADEFDAFFDLFVANEGSIFCCFFCMSFDDLDYLIQKDFATIGTDGLAMRPNSKSHPRAFGSFPTAIRRFVKEKQILTMEEMIKKFTGFAARQYKLEGRGELKENFYADVLVMDPETICGAADYVDCFALSEGIEHVIVNGREAYTDKKLTQVRNGKFLR